MTDEREDQSESIDEAASGREAETEAEGTPQSETKDGDGTGTGTEAETPNWTFDEDLERELDQLGFAGKDETIECEIRGTGEWEPGADITLHVSKPIGEPTFTETLAVPEADEPLTASKFGRLLDVRGYDLEQAKHIVGDTVECTYLGEDEWRIVDPKPPSTDSVSTAEADASGSNTDSSSESRPPARRSSSGSTTSTPSHSSGSSRRNAMEGRQRMRSGAVAIIGAVLLPVMFFLLSDFVIGSPTPRLLVPVMDVASLAVGFTTILLVGLGFLRIFLGAAGVGRIR